MFVRLIGLIPCRSIEARVFYMLGDRVHIRAGAEKNGGASMAQFVRRHLQIGRIISELFASSDPKRDGTSSWLPRS